MKERRRPNDKQLAAKTRVVVQAFSGAAARSPPISTNAPSRGLDTPEAQKAARKRLEERTAFNGRHGRIPGSPGTHPSNLAA
jgi:hypothetical protein